MKTKDESLQNFRIMGNQDLERLYPVYRACVDFSKLADLPYSFKEDSGNYETAIQFQEGLSIHPPNAKNWDTNPDIICPDILDFEHKIIIEFEEETGNRKSGAHYARKGHGHEGDLSTKRDTRRNEYYEQYAFRVFRLWETTYKNENWKIKLFEFLIGCWKNE